MQNQDHSRFDNHKLRTSKVDMLDQFDSRTNHVRIRSCHQLRQRESSAVKMFSCSRCDFQTIDFKDRSMFKGIKYNSCNDSLAIFFRHTQCSFLTVNSFQITPPSTSFPRHRSNPMFVKRVFVIS